MYGKKSWAFVAAAFLLPVALNCECGETKVSSEEAMAGKYHVGDSALPPALESYVDTPAGQNPKEAEISIDFGMVDLGKVVRKYLFVRNTGTANLNVVGVDWPVADASFVIACQDGGVFLEGCALGGSDFLEIGSGADLVVEVSYAPTRVAANSASFVVRTNAGDFRAIRVQLSGQGVTPEIQVCIANCIGDQQNAECQAAAELCNDAVEPESLAVDFGDTVSGDSVERLVVVRNQGDWVLGVSGLSVTGGDFGQFTLEVTDGVLPGVLNPGAEARVLVSYQPFLGGNHQSTLQIISDDVNEAELQVRLVGRGLAPRVCPDPYILDFGNVAVGDPPRDLFFTVTNCGLLELSLNDLQMSQNSSLDFSLANPPAFPMPLAPGASVEVHVLYQPGDRGSDHGGVDIYSNDPSSNPTTGLTGTVSLTGNGIVRECEIQPIPLALSFGGVVQQNSDALVITLSNQGNDTCRIDAVEIADNSPDNEFSILKAPDPGTPFLPGDVVMPEVQVQYAPVNLGVDNGRLKITCNDRDGPELFVNLVGEGVATAVCELSVQPTAMRFGTVKLNNTQGQVITVSNTGNAPCHLDTPKLYPSTLFPSDFQITRGPAGPFTLARRGQPGDREEIEITFAPSKLGMHKTVLWLHTPDDPDFIVGNNGMCFIPGFPPVYPQMGDACILIGGNSAESDIEVVPAELDFGVVTVGCNSPEMHVTVYNLGSIQLNVTGIYLENEPDPNFEITSAPFCTPQSPYVLAGGSSFEIRLRYHPQDTNPHRTALYLESDASNVNLLAIPLYGRGTNISSQIDVFHQPEQVKSDVLFVVDNSGSMGEEQQALADNFSYFIQWATTLVVDFHIGVISTEVNDPETNQGSPPREIIPGVLVQAPGRPKIITNTTPDINAAFGDNVKLGTCCADEQESGLQAAWMALSPPNIDDPSMNGGFLREDAKLYIICVSDEQDQSKGNPDFYTDFFSSIKGFRNTEMMKVSAVCGDCPSGCGGLADCGSRYIEVASQTGGIFESICTSSWAQALQNLGIDAFARIREFPLSRTADPSTIAVWVNDIPVNRASCRGCADGWTYYEDTNTIFFGDNCVPDKGDLIEVSYTAACL